MSGTSTSENQNQVSLKELREEFYKIRKFEIQNLWQRSIFLATFIVLLFTGYGAFFEKLMSYDGLQSIIGHNYLLPTCAHRIHILNALDYDGQRI